MKLSTEVLKRLAPMVLEDLAALLEDPDAAANSVRLNVKANCAFASGRKSQLPEGLVVKGLPDGEAALKQLGTLVAMAVGYIQGSITEVET